MGETGYGGRSTRGTARIVSFDGDTKTPPLSQVYNGGDPTKTGKIDMSRALRETGQPGRLEEAGKNPKIKYAHSVSFSGVDPIIDASAFIEKHRFVAAVAYVNWQNGKEEKPIEGGPVLIDAARIGSKGYMFMGDLVQGFEKKEVKSLPMGINDDGDYVYLSVRLAALNPEEYGMLQNIAAGDAAKADPGRTGLDTSTIRLNENDNDAIAGMFGNNGSQPAPEQRNETDDFTSAWENLEVRLDPNATRSQVKKVNPGELPADVARLVGQINHAK